MAATISVQKGSVVALNVVASYVVAALAIWASKKFGVVLDDAMQTELTIAGVALLTGFIHGVLNWLKHRGIPVIPTTTTPAPQ